MTDTPRGPWADPDVVAQIEALGADKSAEATLLDALRAQAELSCRSGDPLAAAQVRIMAAILPDINAIKTTPDALVASNRVVQLADALAFGVACLMLLVGKQDDDVAAAAVQRRIVRASNLALTKLREFARAFKSEP